MRAGKYTKVTVDDNGTLTDVGFIQNTDLNGALSTYSGNITASAIRLNGSNGIPLVVDVADAGFIGFLIQLGVAGSDVFHVGTTGDTSVNNLFAADGGIFDGGVAINGASSILYVANSAQIDNSLSVGNGITNLVNGITNDGGILNNTGVISGSFTLVGSIATGAVLDFANSNVLQVTPNAAAVTVTALVPPAGSLCNLIVLSATSATARVITFGTSTFRTTATLSTAGTGTLARTYTISFISDGNKLNEISRTAAMVT